MVLCTDIDLWKSLSVFDAAGRGCQSGLDTTGDLFASPAQCGRRSSVPELGAWSVSLGRLSVVTWSLFIAFCPVGLSSGERQ